MTHARLRRLLNLLLHPVPAAILALLFSLLLFDAFPADSLMYHLPFSARLLHLPGAPDFANVAEGRYQGFPSLWRVLLGPGLVWNHPRLFIVPNLFALGLLVYCCRRFLGLSRSLVVCCCLTFPVALYGFRSSLQDFFVNILVLTASIVLFQSIPRRDGDHRKTLWIEWWDLLALLCLVLAANVKFQGLFMAVLVLVAASFFRWRDGASFGGQGLSPQRRTMLVAAILIALIFAQPLQNISRFGNPFYPVSVLGLSGTEQRHASPIQYIPRIPILTNAASYLVSAYEIDPIIRSKAGLSFNRSWHNHNLPKSEYQPVHPDYPWIVTGGSNGFLFLLLFVGAVLSVYGSKSGVYPELTPSLILRRRLLITSLLFMVLPQSMELRYYMISLFVPALVAVSGEATSLRLLMRWIVVAGLWLTLFTSFLQPTYYWARTGEWISARGLLSPDVYRDLPSVQDCVNKRELWGGLVSKASDRTTADIQASIACHFRLNQRRRDSAQKP
ncbi:MAG: hypothetical protein QUV07_13550 [Cyanobium sp. CZS 25K]|nr:hypothetical protein [Cyanobium sp. CZS25K]